MPQHIRDVMTSNPCTIDAESSVAYAATMMREEDVGLAPIVEGDRLIGMLTDRDIATRESWPSIRSVDFPSWKRTGASSALSRKLISRVRVTMRTRASW
jgi:signal-transduction protein with cAMP-binding, CBS, and nucleotidyltransferase domain